MADPTPSGGPPSVLAFTVRRSISMGRIYIISGTIFSVFYGGILGLAPGAPFETIFPILVPIFAAIGGMGGMMVFTSDRLKGVYEYLVAYGITPRRLFANVLLASLVQVAIVDSISLTVGIGAYVVAGHQPTGKLLEAVALYTIPMSLATVAFASIVGMYWTSLSSPRSGTNSPIGILPIFGAAPPAAAVVAATAAPHDAVTILFGAVAILVVIVLVLLRSVDRLMPRERLLSPA